MKKLTLLLLFVSFTINAVWQPEEVLSIGVVNTDPQVVMDASGSAMVIWQTGPFKRSNIVASRFNGSSWSAPIKVSKRGPFYTPTIAMNGAGQAVLAWVGRTSIGFNIKATFYDPIEDTFSDVLTITSSGRNMTPQVAIDAAGDAVVVWRETTQNQIFVSEATFSSSWTAPVAISSAMQGCGAPKIALNTSGNGLITWDCHFGSVYSVQRTGGTYSAPILLSEHDFTRCPQVAVNDTDDGLITWFLESSIGQITAASFPGGVFSLQKPHILNGDSQNANPKCAIDSNGDGIVVWNNEVSGMLYYSTLISQDWAFPGVLVPTSGEAGLGNIVANGTGQIAAVWIENPDQSVVASSFTALTPFATTTVISSLNNNESPQIAMNDAGEMVAVWVANNTIKAAVNQ